MYVIELMKSEDELNRINTRLLVSGGVMGGLRHRSSISVRTMQRRHGTNSPRTWVARKVPLHYGPSNGV